jgi:hypothetical protein
MIHKAVTVAIRWPFSTSGLGRIANIRGAALRFLLWCLWLFGGLLLAGGPAQAETNPGDILIVDQLGGTNNLGALLLVDPKTGHRTVLSDFGVPQDNQAPLGAAPASIAVGSEGRIFVSDLFAGGPPLSGALFEVDPDTGTRTLLSNFGQGNIQGFLYSGLADVTLRFPESTCTAPCSCPGNTPNLPIPALHQYQRHGALLEVSGGSPLRGPGVGAWEHFDRHEFVARFKFFLFNPDGSRRGSEEVTSHIRLTGPDEFTATASFDLFDTKGNIIAQGCVINETATRFE